MDTVVFAAVLAAAALHAFWNSLVKGGPDKSLTAVMVAGSSGAIALPLLPLLQPVAAGSWPYIAASAALQALYLVLLSEAYRAGDMSATYPLMRGSAAALVGVAGSWLFREHLTGTGRLGVAAIAAGVLGMAVAATDGGGQRVATALALANGSVIAAYTLVDAGGVRLSGSPAAYVLWVFLLSGTLLLGWSSWQRGAELRRHVAERWPRGLAAGLGSIASYGTALWAMTKAPVVSVAALRETSILFGMLIAAAVLGERPGGSRTLCAAAVAVGVIALRLG